MLALVFLGKNDQATDYAKIKRPDTTSVGADLSPDAQAKRWPRLAAFRQKFQDAGYRCAEPEPASTPGDSGPPKPGDPDYSPTLAATGGAALASFTCDRGTIDVVSMAWRDDRQAQRFNDAWTKSPSLTSLCNRRLELGYTRVEVAADFGAGVGVKNGLSFLVSDESDAHHYENAAAAAAQFGLSLTEVHCF